ncbi:MAG: Crp/Fnr family transcriptional regulator [Ardenticatenaceae bacterium]|nr:Crp/Fnr family transcriptional regulator [Ardenticatenaceae bacterium]
MLTEATLSQLLFQYPVVHQLPVNLQHTVCQTAVFVRLPANRILFREGEPSHYFIMPLTGSVRVVKPEMSGREIMLYRTLPGDSCLLTVSCLLGNQTYTARGIVDESFTAVLIPKPLFIELITQSDLFRTQVFKYFSERLTLLIQLIEEVTFQKLDQRLASTLLHRGPVLHITQQQLADDLGSVREVVSRLLNAFKDLGAIEIQRGKILVINRTILQQFSVIKRD